MTTKKQALHELADWMERHGVECIKTDTNGAGLTQFVGIELSFLCGEITSAMLREKAEGL